MAWGAAPGRLSEVLGFLQLSCCPVMGRGGPEKRGDIWNLRGSCPRRPLFLSGRSGLTPPSVPDPSSFPRPSLPGVLESGSQGRYSVCRIGSVLQGQQAGGPSRASLRREGIRENCILSPRLSF